MPIVSKNYKEEFEPKEISQTVVNIVNFTIWWWTLSSHTIQMLIV
jgi:hypothetical protein